MRESVLPRAPSSSTKTTPTNAPHADTVVMFVRITENATLAQKGDSEVQAKGASLESQQDTIMISSCSCVSYAMSHVVSAKDL